MGTTYIKTSSGAESVLPNQSFGSASEVLLNKNIIIRAGFKSITVSASTQWIPLFTSDELSEMFGITISDPSNMLAFVENADSSKQEAHLQSCVYRSSLTVQDTSYKNTWFIKADRSLKGTLDVTYAFIYFNNTGTQTGIYIKTPTGADAVQTGYDCKGIKKMYAGTKVITLSNNNSKAVHTEAEISAVMGDGSTKENILCCYCNGDGSANGSHIDGCTYVPSDKTWRIVLQNGTSTSGSFRVNFLIFRW